MNTRLTCLNLPARAFAKEDTSRAMFRLLVTDSTFRCSRHLAPSRPLAGPTNPLAEHESAPATCQPIQQKSTVPAGTPPRLLHEQLQQARPPRNPTSQHTPSVLVQGALP
jgi:hypothetical protein